MPKYCAVPKCTTNGGFKFPANPQLQRQWLVAINRELLKPKDHSVVCAKHFRQDDFKTPIFSTVSVGAKQCRYLKPGAVPSIFDSDSERPSATPTLDKNADVNIENDGAIAANAVDVPVEHQNIFEEPPEVIHEYLDMASDVVEVTVTSDDVKMSEEIFDSDNLTKASQNDNAGMPVEYQTDDLSTNTAQAGAAATKRTHVGQLVSIEQLKENEEMMKYYTGFGQYDHFIFLFQGLGPAANDLKYKSRSLGPMDELLLTLIKLRQDKDDVELGFLFGISKTTAGRIFNTWLSFMYYQFKEIKLFQGKETVQEHMPRGFKSQFPSTRIILDATEIPIEKPSNVADQRSTYSTYKNRNTLKTMVGVSPRGVVTYVSEAYGGAASDRQIIEHCSLLDGHFERGDSIMADRGILVQDLFAGQDVQVNTPTTMKGVNQLPAETVVKDRRIARKCVHVERVIGLAKTYKILANELDHSKTPRGGKILFVCFILSNFRKNIVPKFC